MTGLACWVLVVAAADLARSRRAVGGVGLAVPAAAVGIALVALAVAAGPDAAGVVAWVVGVAGAVVWVAASASGWTGRPGRTRVVAAFAAFALALTAFVAAGRHAGDLSWLHDVVAASALPAGVTAERAVLVAGVVLAQLGTANLVVRLLLSRVGVPAPDNEKRLPGGRFLGPMERILIVGLGLAGSLGGAAVVVAAKALLRFPELRDATSRGEPGGASDVTEYFLVGSFASWLVAFGALALTTLA